MSNYRYLIVVFTGKDMLDSQEQDFDDFLSNGTHPMVEELLRKCDNRCVAFNNKATGEESYTQVTQLLDILDGMIRQNDNAYFSAEDFGTKTQRVRRYFASALSRQSRRFDFNLGTIPVLAKVMPNTKSQILE